MSMLLTLSQSTHSDLGRSIHDFPSKFHHLQSRPSPLPKIDHSVTHHPDIKPFHETPNMATSHRGLPPPAGMQLPDPGRPPPPPPTHTAMGQPQGAMPAPPSHWQGQEESMRHWLTAKAEEDRRKQEEEKTRQETLKLEQRRIEQSILRESLQGGVPPQMVPIIYAGMGGAGLVHLSAEWLHQYASQLQMSSQQHHSQADPESRSQRMLGSGAYTVPSSHGAVYAAEAGTPLAGQMYSANSRPTSTSAPRSIAQASLPRLSTNDMYIPQAPAPASAHPLQQTQTINPDAAASPSIYFHHWVPPGGDNSKVPQTPVSKSRREDEPSSAHPGSHISDGEYRDSPRKRKAQGGHQPIPPPSTALQYGSPSFSIASTVSTKRPSGHQRHRSSTSFKEEYRPDSRREESHRFSFVPAAALKEVEGPERGAERREKDEETVTTVTAGTSLRQSESQHRSPRGSMEERRLPPVQPPSRSVQLHDERG